MGWLERSDSRIATIAGGYGRKTNKVLAGFLWRPDVARRMKRISRKTGSGKVAVKRLILPLTRVAPISSQDEVRVRRNDPLAIGIEELERSFWPPARSRRRLFS